MPVLEPRGTAAAFLLFALIASLLLCRRLAARSSRPATVWAAGAYWAWLHLVGLYGLLSSTRFETAIAPLTLFTFPLSVAVNATIHMQGFVTLSDFAINYLRYFVCCGGLNVLLIAGFIWLLLPPNRSATHSRSRHAVSR